MLDMGFSEDLERLTTECVNRQQTLLFSATSGGNGLREIVGKIPASQLQGFENAGHSSFVEEATRFNAALADFVQRQAVAESP